MLQKTSKRQKQTSGAVFYFSRSKWSKKLKQWRRVYRIYPPVERPFLPSDVALRKILSTIPSMRLLCSERFSDRDFFTVYGRDKNIFITRADRPARAIRAQFLAEVGMMAEATRDTPAHVTEAAAKFLADNNLREVEWTGKKVLACDWEGYRYETGLFLGDKEKAFQKFKRLCTPYLPFLYEATPP